MWILSSLWTSTIMFPRQSGRVAMNISPKNRHMLIETVVAGKEYKLILENYMLAAVEDAKA